MDIHEQRRDEDHYRRTESAMLSVEDARRELVRTADALEADAASVHLISALRTAADALAADHKRLMQSVYWSVQDDGQQNLLAS